jgi:hypothetical protein
VRLAIAIALCVCGILLLATPALALGLAMMLAGWWVYERSGLRGGDGFITLLMVLGGLGCAAVVAEFILQRV